MEHTIFATTTPTPNRLESLRLLSLAETHLTARDLPTAKTHATRARVIDPSTHPVANKILAVIDTLLSSDRKIGNNQPDLYGVLGLSPQQQNDNVVIFNQFQKLVRLLENNKYPFADVALRSVVGAFEVLSNPVKKAVYDKELAFYLQQQRLADPLSFCRLPSMQQNFIYFGGSAAVNSPFSRGFGVSLGSNVSMNNNIGSSSSNGGNNYVRGFSAFVRSGSDSVPVVVEGNGTNGGYVNDGGRNDCNVNVDEEIQLIGNGSQSFMDILGMDDNNNNHVQGFSAFVSSNVVPVVEGSGTDRDYLNVNVVEENQDRVEETNGEYSNVGERKEPDVNVVEGNQDKLKETNGDYSNADVNGSENEVNVEGVDVKGVVGEEEEERVEETGDETGNGGVEGTFWTACPYCCCMFEYPGVYVDCCLRCQFCKSAFQGVAIASPPAIVKGEDGKEGYYCCWSFFPVGVSKETWEKCNVGNSGWTPFSPMFAEPGKGKKGCGSSGPRVYVDDDEAWMESSESEEFNDVDWIKGKTRKQTRVTRAPYKIAKKLRVDTCSENRKKRTITPTRRQPSRASRNSGKLDLNVEGSSNEADEPPSKRNAILGRGEEDNNEGNGHFEGLNEYLSSFPILDGVEGDDKAVKVA